MDDFTGDAVTLSNRKKEEIEILSLHAQIPENAMVTATQAESSLGHNLADEYADSDDDDAADRDVRAETLALAGVPVNSDSVNYSCLALDLQEISDTLWQKIGEPNRDLLLDAELFQVSEQNAADLLTSIIHEQQALTSPEGIKDHEQKVSMLETNQVPCVCHNSQMGGGANACRKIRPRSAAPTSNPHVAFRHRRYRENRSSEVCCACDEARFYIV